MKNYFVLLDALRFFAAIWVMNLHYFLRLEKMGELTWYRYGALGVQLFFIISGFVIIQTLNNKNLKDFAFGRFVRLFPLFWVLCTLTYIITLIVPGANPLHINEYLITMTMMGDVINGLQHNDLRLIDPSYWTLTVELIFYASIGIFTYLFSYKNIRYFLASWLIFSGFSFIFGLDQNVYIKLALVRHAAYFIFGGALALIVTKQATNLFEKLFDRGLLLMSAVYAILIHPRALQPFMVAHPFDTQIITVIHIVFFLGILLLVYLSKYIKNTKIIRALMILGGITYPLYLLHQTIGDTLINFITNNLDITWNVVVIIFQVFIVLVAFVFYREDKKFRFYLKNR